MAEDSNPTVHPITTKSDDKHQTPIARANEGSKDNSSPHDPQTSVVGNSFSRASGRLYKALRRKSSMTLPSKKPTADSKKRVSLPRMDVVPCVPLSSTVEMPGSAVNHQRPLPPSPPLSPVEPLEATLSYSAGDKKEELKDSDVEVDPNMIPLAPLDEKTSSQSEIPEKHADVVVGNASANHVSEVPFMPLKNALEKYKNHFPLRLKFMEGYCSEDSECNLSTSEIYDIHFVKKTRVVSLKDNNGFMHKISLASAITFGLLYDPNNNIEEALAGYTFKHCSDILAADITPPVVCATDVITSPEEHNIAQNEILLVKDVLKPKFRGKKYLKVFSFLTYTHKLLPEECQGNFTTKPSLIRLHPQQIVECMSKPFPVQAIPYNNPVCHDTPDKCSVHFTGVVTLCNCTTETSLVASPVSDNLDDNPISLHLNQEITQLEVEVISWKEDSQNTDNSDMVAIPEHEECNSITDVYDDIVILKQKATEDDASSVYDDVVGANGKGTSVEENYATVGEQDPNDCPTESGYDKVPFETLAHSSSTLESR